MDKVAAVEQDSEESTQDEEEPMEVESAIGDADGAETRESSETKKKSNVSGHRKTCVCGRCKKKKVKAK